MTRSHGTFSTKENNAVKVFSLEFYLKHVYARHAPVANEDTVLRTKGAFLL